MVYFYLDRNEGPQPSSIYNFIKLSFKEGFSTDIISILNDCIQKRKWEASVTNVAQGSRPLPPIKLRTGIVGIERSLQEKQKATDESITIAFQDLSKLMSMAKDMVRLSQNISSKIRVSVMLTIANTIRKVCFSNRIGKGT